MKKLLAVFLLAFLVVPLSIQAEEYTGDDQDDYDRIYKDDDGNWYGVVEIEAREIVPPVTGFPNQSTNAIFIDFSREMDALTSISYDYITYEYCDGSKILGLCFGEKKVDEETETVYEEDQHGAWENFFNGTTSGIEESTYKDYDFVIYSETELTIETVEAIEFTYILPDEETDNVNEAIQQQYDDELKAIMEDGTLDMEEKQAAVDALNEEYQDYVLEYGEDITQICEGEMCTINSPSPDFDISDLWQDVKTLVITIAVIASVGLVLFMVGLQVLTDLLSMTLSILVALADGLATIITKFVWEPLYQGLKVMVNVIYKLLFWWM